MKKSVVGKLVLASLLGGLLCAIGWDRSVLFPLLLVAWIPFFWALWQIRESDFSFFKKLGLLALSVFFFRGTLIYVGTSWAFELSQPMLHAGALSEWLTMTVVLIPVIFRRINFIIILPLLILYEFLLQKFMMLTPNYIMGYSWASRIELVQYYRYLGVEGGSVILYLVNFFLFKAVLKKKMTKMAWGALTALGLVSGLSLILFYTFKTPVWDQQARITLLHSEMKSFGSEAWINNPSLAVKTIEENTPDNTLLVTPEGFFNGLAWMHELRINKTIQEMQQISKEKNQAWLIGANLFSGTREPNPQSRYLESGGFYYNVHNTAMLIDPEIRITSKQIFIPFQEYVPSNFAAQWINKMIPVIGSRYKFLPLDRDDIFTYKNKPFDIMLCYGSVYPLLAAKKAEGNQFLVIQANESWNSSERCQQIYLNMNKMDAIATGLIVYRASNMGYSAVILPNGKLQTMSHQTKEMTPWTLPLPKTGEASFYTHIAGYTYGLALLSLLGALFISFWKKEGQKIKSHP